MGKKREPEPPPDAGIAGRMNVAMEYQGLRDLDAALERATTTLELRALGAAVAGENHWPRIFELVHGFADGDLRVKRGPRRGKPMGPAARARSARELLRLSIRQTLLSRSSLRCFDRYDALKGNKPSAERARSVAELDELLAEVRARASSR